MRFRSVVPDSRLIEIIRGYIASQSTEKTMPDMRGEIHLLAVARLVVDETRARMQLYELEVRK
jgi:hypothetical protein